MGHEHVSDTWERGNPYEQYVGRWSRRVAPPFLSWLGVPAGRKWLDVGCGTGALSAAIVDHCSPSSVTGVEPSGGFLETARANLAGRAVFRQGSATAVWDYAGRMDLMRAFWDAVVELDPDAASMDEGRRFPVCRPEALEKLFESAGLNAVEVTAIDIPTQFGSFEDYWKPFLGGQGPAPAYAMSLDERARSRLQDRIRQRLPVQADGSILLTARAWAVRSIVQR